MNDSVLREQLVTLLEKGEAHTSARRALSGIDPELRSVRPAEGVHSIWEELEHMRMAQEDILRYTLDAGWKSPPWPEGYWPGPTSNVTEEMWANSVAGFFSDLEEVIELARNPRIDLTARIPHGGDHTYLREILLVADHNAYHLGQIVQTRKALGDWNG
ncbi:MAG: DinB family protein [Blastocatellia bacterium]|nr:DinB family protein [Blastocatellia bacterium]